MKKLLLIFILFVASSFAETNTAGTNNNEEINKSVIKQLTQTSFYIEEGAVFKAPFTGWFFGREPTKRLLKNDTDAEKLRNINEALKIENGAYKSINEYFVLKIDFQKAENKETERSRRLEKIKGPFLFFTGVIIGGLTTFGAVKLAKDL